MFDFRLHLSNSCQYDCVRFALKFILLNFQVDNSVLRSGYFFGSFLTFVEKKLHLSIVNLQIHSAFGLHSSCDVERFFYRKASRQRNK